MTNVTWTRGELEHLLIADGQAKVGMPSQQLHHAREPARAVAETVRVTAPGGRVLALDLRTRRETWVRGTLGDRVLGVADAEFEHMLALAGLRDVRVAASSRKAGDPFTVLVASGTKSQTRLDTRTQRQEDK